MTTSTRTRNFDGHGFTAENVPAYLDEACKAYTWLVFKGKASAQRKADVEALRATQHEYDGVEGIVATQIDGFDGLWFVVIIYTDEAAAKQARSEAIRAASAQR